MAAEMALYHANEGRTLFDQLRNLWKKHGYFEETLISKTFKGEAGLQKMNELMENLRKNPPEVFAGQPLQMIKDYKTGSTYLVKDKSYHKDIDLPPSNVLQFILLDGSIVTARPSGTEPKIKFYASCRGIAGETLEKSVPEVKNKISTISQALNLID